METMDVGVYAVKRILMINKSRLVCSEVVL